MSDQDVLLRNPILGSVESLVTALKDEARTSSSQSSPLRRGRGMSLGDVDVDSFRCEDGSSSSLDRQTVMSNILLENPEAETRWYFKYFLGQSHENFVAHLVPAGSTQRELVVLSVLIEAIGPPGGDMKQCRAILWSRAGSERLLVPFKGKTLDPRRIIPEFGKGQPEKKIEPIQAADVQRDLLVVEEQEGAVNFKFGILLALPGQQTDDEMFSNEHGTPDFDDFCSLMGNRVRLRDWAGFRGGLDVKNGTTGEFSIHTVEFGKDIMFHVSTLLPYSKDDPQQLERKRHLGNDICNIVFLEDGDSPFSADMIRSKFNHIFAVVSRDKATRDYVLRIYSRNSVPEFGPPLPNPAHFTSPVELRKFLIVKLMNGEKSALSSPFTSFALKKQRTLQALLEQIHDNYTSTTSRRKGAVSSPRSIHDPHTFRTHGQTIKLEKVVAGSAPTSLKSIGGFSSLEPWAPVCVAGEFPSSILCAGSLGSDLIVSTPDSVIHLGLGMLRPDEQSTNARILIDDSLTITQLEVDELTGNLFFLAVKPFEEEEEDKLKRFRGGQVYACPVSQFQQLDRPHSKKSLRSNPIAATKGAHLFAINSTSVASTTKLATAIGKRVRLFTMADGATADSAFIQTHELLFSETVEAISLGHGLAHASAGQVCVGLRGGEFHLCDLDTSIGTTLYLPGELRGDPVVCVSVPSPHSDQDYGEHEWLLCFNQIVFFKDSVGQSPRTFDVRFSARPQGVAYAYPYILGFLADSIEIFTLINGNLLKTLQVPGLTLLCTKRDIYFTARGRDDSVAIYRITRDGLGRRQ